MSTEFVNEVERATADKERDGYRIYVTSSGVTLRMKPFSPGKVIKAEKYLRILAKQNLKSLYGDDCFDVPTYSIEGDAGVKETFEHDEKSILSYPAQADHYRRWKDASEQLDQEFNMLLLKYAVSVAIQVDVPPPDPAEEEANEFFGIPTAKNGMERKIDYVMGEALASTEDYNELMRLVRGNVDDEDVAAAAENFRSELWQEANAAGQPTAEGADASMVDIAALPRNQRGEGVGADA